MWMMRECTTAFPGIRNDFAEFHLSFAVYISFEVRARGFATDETDPASWGANRALLTGP
jgi:hypothetical protein